MSPQAVKTDPSFGIDHVLAEELRWLFPEPGRTVERRSAASGGPAPSTRAADADDGTAGATQSATAPEAAAPAAPDRLAALCLSGGGIRSATFCLGVLQGLAGKGLLDRFHYLSTVSGGGYIGCWLSGWIMRAGLPAVIAELQGNGPGLKPDHPLRRLRACTNFLSPVWGLSTDFLSLVAIFVRNLALHWFVLLPLIAAALMLPRLQIAALSAFSAATAAAATAAAADTAAIVALGFAVLFLVFTIAYFVADLPGDPPLGSAPKDRFIYACFLPLLLSTLLFSWVGAWKVSLLTHYDAWLPACGAAAHFAAIVFGVIWRICRGLKPRNRRSIGLDLLVVLASGGLGGWLLGLAAQRVESMHPLQGDGLTLYATVAVPVLLVIFWAGVTCYSGLASRLTSDDDREWWARSAAWWLGAGVVWLLAAGLVIYLPVWLLGLPWLQTASGASGVGIGATLLGVATAATGYWSKNGATLKEKAKGFIAASGTRLLDLAALLTTVVLLLAISFAVSSGLRQLDATLDKEVTKSQRNDAMLERHWREPAAQPAAGATAAPFKRDAASAPAAVRGAISYETVVTKAPLALVLVVFGVLLAMGGLVSWLCGINTFSLHGMYASRLARAYLGASNPGRKPHWFTGFDPLDDPKLAAVTCGALPDPRTGRPVPRPQRRLFPVINVALNLVKATQEHLDWQQRKATSFTLSPLFCGSAALGFAPTAQYGGAGGVSLGRAMAISGAAAAPNMGYHTSSLVAFVMTFFNIRLGWWMPNPKGIHAQVWEQREPRLGLLPLLAEATASTTADRDFVALSDGGHFENLGLYEMVRRGCRDIVVVDATCDPNFAFEDLQSAIRKIRIDFGIPITFTEPLPDPKRMTGTLRRVALAKIDYAQADSTASEGRLVYIKPILAGDEPLDVERYAAANNTPGKAFPHQTTADQFFDESQFESYRMLGQHIVEKECSTIGAFGAPLQAGPAARDVAAAALFAGSLAGAGGTAGADDRSWWGGVSDGVQSMNQSALLATALTLGGVVGVSGTLGLREGSQVQVKPGAEIRVAEADLAALRTGVPLTLAPEAASAVAAQVTRIVALAPTVDRVTATEKRIDALTAALQSVASAASAASGAASGSSQTTINNVFRNTTLDQQFQTQLQVNARALTQLQVAIDDLKRTLAAPPQSHPAASAVLSQLGAIEAQLKAIEQRVADTLPRRNIRGVTEGAR